MNKLIALLHCGQSHRPLCGQCSGLGTRTLVHTIVCIINGQWSSVICFTSINFFLVVAKVIQQAVFVVELVRDSQKRFRIVNYLGVARLEDQESFS